MVQLSGVPVEKPKISRVIDIKSKIDKDSILAALENKFGTDTFREDVFDVHSETQSVIIKFMDMRDGPLEEYSVFKDLLKEIQEEYNFKDIKVLNAMFAKLPPGKGIDVHMDTGDHFRYIHRIHYAIQTNKDVIFHVDGTELSFLVNPCMEINNLAMHFVYNGGDKDRIHLIIDVYDGAKTKQNKEGY